LEGYEKCRPIYSLAGVAFFASKLNFLVEAHLEAPLELLLERDRQRELE
jgi:hypothetical protein